MKSLIYPSGDEVRQGDQITYHGEPGTISFIITAKSSDPAMDWYMEQFPEGGCMASVENMGSVFLANCQTDEDLKFIARRI